MKRNSFKNTYIGLMLRQLKHRISYKYKYLRMKKAYERYENCKDKKPKRQIREEIAICKKYWGCYPLYYFRYDLYRKDIKLTKEELINYIPEFFFYSLFLSYFDTDKYSILLSDKNITELLFRSASIKQPNVICKLINGKTYTKDLKEKSFDEINIELKEKLCKKIFVKPVDGEGGHGIMVFHLNENNQYVNSDHEEFNEGFLLNIGKERDYIIQEGIIQHESISKIYPSAVNTFRIATENLKGKVRVICSVLRMGKEGREVDNISMDGISLGVDHNTGVLNEYGATEEGEIFYKHPDTKFVFDNYKIDEWDNVKNFAIECASKLPQFTYLGWDIALTEEGPIAIETNMGFGIDLYQIALGGLREAFKIDDPNKFWKNRRGNCE